MRAKISLSSRGKTDYAGNSQKIDFLYLYNGNEESSGKPQKNSDYNSLLDVGNGVIFMNYEDAGPNEFGVPTGVSTTESANFATITIYKREVWDDGEETIWHPVVVNGNPPRFTDYNVAAGRNYEYTVYPVRGNDAIRVVQRGISVKWQYWSITELHPQQDNPLKFTAAPEDVWLFKYNVEPGTQTQNLLKNKQENLTAFPKITQGPSNYLSGDVSCLLGSEMIPYEFLKESNTKLVNVDYDGVNRVEFKPEYKTVGGYTERLRYGVQLTSNQKVDMLNAWRKVCYSGNPKLLKDMKGQRFIIQIVSASNTPNNNWRGIPDSLQFSWVQIADADDYMITNDYAAGANPKTEESAAAKTK